MFKVQINSLTGDSRSPWSSSFDTQELAQEWFDKQIGKSGRKDAYWTDKEPSDFDGSNYPRREVDLGDGTFKYEYEIPAEFSYTIEDISEQIADDEKKRAIMNAFGQAMSELAEELKNDDFDQIKNAYKSELKKLIKGIK